MIEMHERKFGFSALNLNSKHLYDIVEDGYIEKIRTTTYEKEFCQKCRIKGDTYKSIEKLLLESIRQRKKGRI
jgi:hypothetical protein